MYRTINIRKLKITFVFRHKWDKEERGFLSTEFYTHDLGLWFRKSRIVGTKNFRNPKKWKDNLVSCYMVGINLLVCKAWIDWSIGGMHLKA